MSETRQIRAMTLADVDAVLRIECACYSHPWTEDIFRGELANSISRIDLLLLDGKIAGYLCSWFVCGELEIHNVATAPQYQRRGVATSLMEHLFDLMRREGLERAFLEVRESNEGAIALYRHFGFAVSGHRRRYYPDGEDAVLMEWRCKELTTETGKIS